MKCKKCGDERVHWRCTNNQTQIAKYKCQNCGHIMEKVYKKEKAENKELKRLEAIGEKKNNDDEYIRKTTAGTYAIKKYNSTLKYEVSYGTYKELECAKAVRNRLKQLNFNRDKLWDIYEELGIHKEGRHWVWT